MWTENKSSLIFSSLDFLKEQALESYVAAMSLGKIIELTYD